MSTNNNGFLLINKPAGPTSHDVIDGLRKITGIRQIGHAGTLDPFASGLLLVGVGEATKLLRHYVGLDKKYEAVLRLGAVSDTYDRAGTITPVIPTPRSPASCGAKGGRNLGFTVSGDPSPPKAGRDDIRIESVLKSFVGKQRQLPPMYSAKKIGGKKLYELAREGKSVERRPIDIEVYDIKLLSIVNCQLSIVVRVSSGAYIRALAHDIGQKLGVGAYLEELKRTTIGEFRLEDAVSFWSESREARRTKESSPPFQPVRRSPPNRRGEGGGGARGGFGQKTKLDSIGRPDGHRDSLQNDSWGKYLIPIKTVLVSGTFDGVHEGHKNYFQQARRLGQRLICIVARDQIAEQIKGRRPRYSEKERLKFVKECPEIDRVYLGIAGSQSQIYDFTASLKPDIIALGYDQTAYTENLEEEMKKRGLTVKIVRLKPYHPAKYHSSIINKQTLTGKQKTANL